MHLLMSSSGGGWVSLPFQLIVIEGVQEPE